MDNITTGVSPLWALALDCVFNSVSHQKMDELDWNFIRRNNWVVRLL